VEEAPAEQLCATPLHPYTRALFAAALPADPDDQDEALVVRGSVPSALKPPSGCSFHPRCPFAMPRCAEERPELSSVNGATRRVACHLY